MNWASLVAQRVKRMPGMQETQVQSLDREDPLEKAMASHYSTLACRIPWREEPGRLYIWYIFSIPFCLYPILHPKMTVLTP